MEDLKQELMIAYLLAWPNFDENKGHKHSFIKAVINNHARYLIDVAQSQKRWTGQKELSLSAPISDDIDLIEMIDTLASDASLYGDVFANLSAASLELDLDIQKLLREMPEDLRSTFELLKNANISEAARLANIPRKTLSSRAKRLRKYLEEHLLKK